MTPKSKCSIFLLLMNDIEVILVIIYYSSVYRVTLNLFTSVLYMLQLHWKSNKKMSFGTSLFGV